jgi:hypothetical protein
MNDLTAALWARYAADDDLRQDITDGILKAVWHQVGPMLDRLIDDAVDEAIRQKALHDAERYEEWIEAL